MKPRRPSYLPGALLALWVGVCACDTGAAAPLSPKNAFTPHRALYGMELGTTTQGSDVNDASGTMFYRFEPQCDGWEVETRVAMRLHYGTGGALEVVESTWTFTSFESYDGSRLTYAVDHRRNGELQEAFAGEAGKDADGGAASFNEGGMFSVELPSGTLFPAEHLIRLLAHARKTGAPFKQVVFDGASIDNPYEVNAIVIGPVHDGIVAVGTQEHVRLKPKNPVLVEASATPDTARDLNVWRVRMAYFPLLSMTGMPDFELEVDYREDGIAERMVQDFGDFTLNLSPRRVEVLAKPECK